MVINLKANVSTQSQSETKRFTPGSTLSASDQLDKGPVMLRTATQTSFKSLKGNNIQSIALKIWSKRKKKEKYRAKIIEVFFRRRKYQLNPSIQLNFTECVFKD